jgi:hypothetical protein
MSFQIDTAFVNQYRNNIQLLVQQKGSRLRPLVRVEPQHAEYEFYDRIGPTDAVEIVGRHQDTPLISTPHDRRRVGLRDFDWADLIDRQDRLKMLIDPTSAYAMNAVYAMGRKMDDMIISAAFDKAYTGKAGQTTVDFPDENVVPVDYVEGGAAENSNLTIGKLRRAKEILDAYDNDPDETRIITVTANSIHSLLTSTPVTNSDYNVVKALVEGQVNTFMGFNFVRTQRLLTDENGYRRHICWIMSKLLLAVSQDPIVDVSVRNDKRNSVQVYVAMGLGATRMEEEGVVEIKVDESKLVQE